MSFSPGGNGGVSNASDMALSNPVTDQGLVYNATVQKWQNKMLNSKSLAYIGTSSSPVTSNVASRPNTTGAVYWICAQGIVPANALKGDLVLAGDSLSVIA